MPSTTDLGVDETIADAAPDEVVARPPQHVHHVTQLAALPIRLGDLERAPRDRGGGEGLREVELDVAAAVEVAAAAGKRKRVSFRRPRKSF